jgi:transcriptional regulator with XRE-family HTH domain
MQAADVRQIRSALRMTQARFAELLGVHPLTVSKWERGQSSPSPHQSALMTSFARAAERQPDVGAVLVQLIVGAGVGLALYHVLKAAFEDA